MESQKTDSVPTSLQSLVRTGGDSYLSETVLSGRRANAGEAFHPCLSILRRSTPPGSAREDFGSNWRSADLAVAEKNMKKLSPSFIDALDKGGLLFGFDRSPKESRKLKSFSIALVSNTAHNITQRVLK